MALTLADKINEAWKTGKEAKFLVNGTLYDFTPDGLTLYPITESLESVDVTLAASHNSQRIVATAQLTVIVPTVGTLGNGFECEVVNDSGGTVTIDGPGGTDVTLADGEIACILETNSKIRVVVGTSTVIS